MKSKELFINSFSSFEKEKAFTTKKKVVYISEGRIDMKGGLEYV